MSRPLSNAEMVLLQADTDYLDAGIPVGGSVVTNWNGMFVLIYHSPSAGYQTTDVTDLPPAKLAELAKWTPAQSILYSIPGAIQETIYSEAETAVSVAKAAGGSVADISQAVAGAIGKTLNNLLAPVVSALMVPLVIAGVVAAVYLMKKA